MLLALMLMLAVGGFALFFRRPAPPALTAIPAPEPLVPMLLQPTAGFPGTISWGPLVAFAGDLPSQPGWRVRYQAVCSMAHRGDQVPWDVYAELLDEKRQFRNFRIKLEDDRVIVDEAAAWLIMIGALKDLASWHEKQDRAKVIVGPELLAVYRAVDKLAESAVPELSTQAKKTQGTLFR